MKRTVTIAAASAALLAGAAAGVALGTPTIVGAQDATVTDPAAPAPDATPSDAPPWGPAVGPRAWMRQALDELVTEGVLTQEQADAVLAKLEASKPRWPGRGGPVGHGHGRHPVAAAEALGMAPGELFEELRAGKSIAQVASERGVDLQVVIDAIVAKQAERLDAAVAQGRLTREEADERKAGLVDRVTEMVQTVPPERPNRRGPRDGGMKDKAPTEQQGASTEA